MSARGRKFLLQAMDGYGSIDWAAKEICLPYRKGRSYVKSMEKRLGVSLVERKARWRFGPRQGGRELMDEGIREIVDEKFQKLFPNG